MAGDRLPIVGAIAAGGLILLTFLPYAILTAPELSVYYGVGPVSPVVLTVFAAVAGIALAGVAADRTDPAAAMGAVLVVGVVLTALLLWWSLAVRGVIGGLSVSATFEWHPWVLVGVAAVIPITASWYAGTILRPQGP